MTGRKPSAARANGIAFLLTVFSLVGLGITIVPQPDGGSVLAGGAVWALAAAAVWQLHRAALSLPRLCYTIRTFALATLLSLIVVFGQSFSAVGTAEWVITQPILSAFKVIGLASLFASGMFLFCRALWKEPVGQRLPCKLRYWHYALILLGCWLPYLFWIYPGTVSNDSVTMLMEAIGVRNISNANPIFQTFMLNCFRWLGKKLGNGDISVILYCGIQAVLMAWLLGVLVERMLKSDAPRWVGIGSLIFLAFNPIFPLYAFCVGKDTNFAMAVLWLMLCCHQLCSQEKPDWKNTLCMCAAAVLCVLLRNPGMYLAVLTLGALLLWTLFRSNRNRRLWVAPALAAVCALCVFVGVRLMLPVLHVAPMPETEEWSLPLQQTARIVKHHPLTEEEQTALEAVLELDQVADAYNGELSDPVKLLWKQETTPQEKAAFFRTWLSLAFRHPDTSLGATFHNTYGYVYPGFMSQIKPTLLIGLQKTTTELDPYFTFSVNPRCDQLIRFTDELAKNPLYRVLVAPGLYGWLTLFAAVFLCRKGQSRYLIAAVPMLFTLAGCVLSAVNGYFRYAMPMYLGAPMLLWLCALSKPDIRRDDL